ncbi:PCC domain-containing protein [Brevundimonas sp.]|jgi:predicted DNA-binding protein with PD1-like motif|uniref:PCC domain-containing protein n=1 Tax=Brevundimonas sp. TaxID=1871086 RepID=UPI0037BECF4D
MNPSDITDIRTGRLATVRLGPNQDLVEGLQQAAAELGFERALVRSGLGSLNDAVIETASGEPKVLKGPAVEILTLSGEIALADDAVSAGVSGVVGETSGAVWAGRFVAGRNLVCVTAEIVIEEVVEGAGRAAA